MNDLGRDKKSFKEKSFFYKVLLRIKSRSGRRRAASLIGGAAVAGVSLWLGSGYVKASWAVWLAMFAITFISQSLFFLLCSEVGSSVFWFLKGALIAAECGGGIYASLQYCILENETGGAKPTVGLWLILWLAVPLAYLFITAVGKAIGNEYEKGKLAGRIAFALGAMFTPQLAEEKERRKGKGRWFAAAPLILFLVLSAALLAVTAFLNRYFNNMDFEAIIFTVRFAGGGVTSEMLTAGIIHAVAAVLISVYLVMQLIKSVRNKKLVVRSPDRGHSYTLTVDLKKRIIWAVTACALLAGTFAAFARQTDFIHYMDMIIHKTTIYEDYYIKPDDTVLTFPEKKRNLIYLYLESMENTYASVKNGGDMDREYMPELVELAKENVNFSNTSGLGGPSLFFSMVSYTMASTVAQTSGITMHNNFNHNISRVNDKGGKFLPNLRRLEDVLHDNGYNQLYIEGTSKNFAGYDQYVGQYEDSVIFDKTSAVDEGLVDKNSDDMWQWGVQDSRLFEIAKEKITQLSQQDKPFFVTMYTMDTHTAEGGHRCRYCDSGIENDYLAAVNCSSRQVKAFVDWVKEQPFYENTTIIMIGDHTGDEKRAKLDIDKDYTRTTFNCIINPAKEPVNEKNRVFTSLDMFPTTLSAIGVEIKGDRLGLGTDLFSGEKTLCEELGKKTYLYSIERRSEFYEKEFMYAQ